MIAITLLIMLCVGCANKKNPDKVINSNSSSISTLNISTSKNNTNTSSSEWLSNESEEVYFNDLKKAVSKNNKKDVWAYVNKTPIYKSEVLIGKAGWDQTINQNLKNISSEEEKKNHLKKYSKTEDQYLQLVIENEILYQQAKKQAFTYNESEIKKFSIDNFNNIQKKIPGYIDKHLKILGYTKDEYLNEILIPGSQKSSIRNQLTKKIHPHNPNESKDVSDAAISKYVESIKKNYDIKILKK